MEDQPTHGTPLIDKEKVASVLKPTTVEVPTAATAPTAKRKPTASELGPKEYCWGTGRRKRAIARVRIRPGGGKILVNNKELGDFFPRVQDQQGVLAPLEATESMNKYDVYIRVHGGGITGQAGAALLGVARALTVADPETFGRLRDKGLLTRDSRMKERKKYGRKKARKSFQFSKR